MIDVRNNDGSLAFRLDETLWVDLDAGCGERRHYLVGNAFTFPGRILVWCPAQQKTTRISKSEIVDQSHEAAYWIAGFLHGATPAPPLDAEGDWFDFDAPEMVEWGMARDEFPLTGHWNENRRCEMCRKRLLPTTLEDRCATCAGTAGFDAERGLELDAEMARRRGLVFTVNVQAGKSKPWMPIEAGMERLPDAMRLARAQSGWAICVETNGSYYWDSRSPGSYGYGAIWRGASRQDETAVLSTNDARSPE
ncbi:MAG: hypothetical protein IPG61_08460 [bacterium]|nr:hypothetical protein [bacterium]